MKRLIRAKTEVGQLGDEFEIIIFIDDTIQAADDIDADYKLKVDTLVANIISYMRKLRAEDKIRLGKREISGTWPFESHYYPFKVFCPNDHLWPINHKPDVDEDDDPRYFKVRITYKYKRSDPSVLHTVSPRGSEEPGDVESVYVHDTETDFAVAEQLAIDFIDFKIKEVWESPKPELI